MREVMTEIAVLVAVLQLASCSGNGSRADAGDAPDDDAGAEEPDDDAADPDTEDAGDEPGSWDEPFTWTLDEPVECPVTVGPDDRYGDLLAAAGLDRTAGLPRTLYAGFGGRLAYDPTRLPVFYDLTGDPDGIPCWSANLAMRADAAVASDHPRAAVIAQGAAELGRFLTVGGRLPSPDPGEPLLEAIRAVHAAAGEDFASEAEVRTAASSVPPEVQRSAAIILLACIESRETLDLAMDIMGDVDRLPQYYAYGSGGWLPGSGSIDPDVPFDAGMFLNSDEGSGRLFSGAARLAQAIDEAPLAGATGAGAFAFSASTPWGQVILGGGGDDAYDGETIPDVLLLIDTGGSDTYTVNAGGSGSWQNPISVAIDLAGDDRYGYPVVASPHDTEGLLPSDAEGRYAGDANYGPFSRSTEPRQGAGVTGYGFLLDLGGGNDVYRTLRRGQGFASFGVGVLWDDGGADDYECEAGCQGSALVGIAVQVDGGGDDSWRSFNSSQGFAWISSFGMLYDAGGSDTRVSVVDDPVVYYSPQTPHTANSSLAQGCAFGWRRDSTGTHLSGGIALLRDVSGNDTYEGSTFVQGTGYWFGMGVLADGDGSDHYDGLFYAQGAGAHFAVGSLIDGGAAADFHNTVRPPLHSMMGLGHDFSVAVMVDDGGDDVYTGPSRSTGASKCHGFGLFADNGGNDSYTALDDKAIGWATDYDWAPGTCGDSTTYASYGFFVDVGGADTYVKPDTTGYGDGLVWITDDPDDTDALEISGGIDSPDGDSYLRAYGP